MLECVDEGGEDEDAHGEEEGEHAKLFVAVPHLQIKDQFEEKKILKVIWKRDCRISRWALALASFETLPRNDKMDSCF